MGTVTLTIDGREVTVDRGTTVLQAARRLGLPVFYSRGIDPLESTHVGGIAFVFTVGKIDPDLVIDNP